MSKKNAIYTCIFNNHDTIKPNPFINQDCDYILFTDVETLENKVQSELLNKSNWTVVILNSEFTARKLAREIKIRAYDFLSDYERTIWMDGSFQQIGDANEFFNMSNESFIALNHPVKKCAYKEAQACITKGLDDIITINSQVDRYKSEGYPPDNGLIMSGILLRDNSEKSTIISKKWWEELSKGSVRDQISFNYSLWKTNQKAHFIEFSSIQHIFKHHLHIQK